MNDRDDDAKFVEIGDEQVQQLRDLAGLSARSAVLDVGCGYGRLAHALLRDPDFRGTYHGFDILSKHIEWCKQHLADHRFRFGHIDILNARYNPRGQRSASSVRWPVRRRSIDVIMLASVFTHMLPEDITHYLQQCRRVLRPGGRGVATFFLLNDNWRQAAAEGRTGYPLPYQLNASTRYFREDDPLHVIAYEQHWVIEAVESARLRVEHVQLGRWAAGGGEAWQDLVVFQRQG